MEERYEEEQEKQIGVCQSIQQHEDAALKTSMQFFAEELLPYLKIPGKVVPIIMREMSVDQLFAGLHAKVEAGEQLTKGDLVSLTLCPLMGGTMPQKERIRSAYRFT